MRILHKALAHLLISMVILTPFLYLYHFIHEFQIEIGVASAHSIDDYLSFDVPGPFPNLSIPAPLDYKVIRAHEICDMAKGAGLGKYCRLLIAHLYSEEGAMDETAITDHGCSYGLLQWNACAHYGMSARGYLSLHPEMMDYRNQVKFYLSEMTWRLQKYGTIEKSIASWNPNGAPWYLQHIKANLAVADKLLSDTL